MSTPTIRLWAVGWLVAALLLALPGCKPDKEPDPCLNYERPRARIDFKQGFGEMQALVEAYRNEPTDSINAWSFVVEGYPKNAKHYHWEVNNKVYEGQSVWFQIDHNLYPEPPEFEFKLIVEWETDSPCENEKILRDTVYRKMKFVNKDGTQFHGTYVGQYSYAPQGELDTVEFVNQTRILRSNITEFRRGFPRGCNSWFPVYPSNTYYAGHNDLIIGVNSVYQCEDVDTARYLPFPLTRNLMIVKFEEPNDGVNDVKISFFQCNMGYCVAGDNNPNFEPQFQTFLGRRIQ
jgi:hypothetical protein